MYLATLIFGTTSMCKGRGFLPVPVAEDFPRLLPLLFLTFGPAFNFSCISVSLGDVLELILATKNVQTTAPVVHSDQILQSSIWQTCTLFSCSDLRMCTLLHIGRSPQKKNVWRTPKASKHLLPASFLSSPGLWIVPDRLEPIGGSWEACSAGGGPDTLFPPPPPPFSSSFSNHHHNFFHP